MSRIIISAGEQKLATGIGNSTTVDSARFVRIYNDSGATAALFVPVSYTHLTLPTILRV